MVFVLENGIGNPSSKSLTRLLCFLFFFFLLIISFLFSLQTFCYNEITDIVQICLKAYGHFDVEPGIEWKVQQIRPNLILPCQYHMTHSSNQVHSRHQKSQLLFSGQGQSLMSQHREAKLSVSSSKKDLPSMGSDAECKNISPYQRLGPGFSILGGEMSNVTNTSLEKIRALAANIDPHLDFNREQVTTRF